jgi:hypothetical protein
MKRVLWTLMLVLVLAALSLAQTTSTTQPSGAKPGATAPQGAPAQGTKPGTQPQGTPPQSGSQPQQPAQPGGQGAPGAAQGAPGVPGAPATRQPQAKTQEEYKAFQEASAAADAAAAEAAANSFAQKFPDSELRFLLFQRAMGLYQNANNAEKTVEMGRKVLQTNAANPIVLVTVATVLAERTRESDLDKDERLAEASKDAQSAINNVDAALPTLMPPGTTPDRIQSTKEMVLSMGYAALGNVELAKNNYPGAEANLRKAVELGKNQPDPVNWLRFSVVLDHLGKYKEALDAANKAVELAPPDSPAANLAKQERERLMKLTGAAGGAAPTATPGASGGTTTAPKPAPNATAPTKPQTTTPPATQPQTTTPR